MDIGKNFKRARERKGIEQKDAAAALDISPSYLSKIERNLRKPNNLDLITKAAKLYGVDEGYFFNKQDKIDINDLYTQTNKEFIKDLSSMSEIDLLDKYNISIDGKTLTKNELKGLIAYVRLLREMNDD